MNDLMESERQRVDFDHQVVCARVQSEGRYRNCERGTENGKIFIFFVKEGGAGDTHQTW